MPANIELSGMEVSLVNAMSRETILRQYINNFCCGHDFWNYQGYGITGSDKWQQLQV
jgi:hypothetical protein